MDLDQPEWLGAGKLERGGKGRARFSLDVGGGNAPVHESHPRMPVQSSLPVGGGWEGAVHVAGTRHRGGKSQPQWESVHSLGGHQEPWEQERAPVFKPSLHK